MTSTVMQTRAASTARRRMNLRTAAAYGAWLAAASAVARAGIEAAGQPGLHLLPVRHAARSGAARPGSVSQRRGLACPGRDAGARRGRRHGPTDQTARAGRRHRACGPPRRTGDAICPFGKPGARDRRGEARRAGRGPAGPCGAHRGHLRHPRLLRGAARQRGNRSRAAAGRGPVPLAGAHRYQVSGSRVDKRSAIHHDAGTKLAIDKPRSAKAPPAGEGEGGASFRSAPRPPAVAAAGPAGLAPDRPATPKQ